MLDPMTSAIITVSHKGTSIEANSVSTSQELITSFAGRNRAMGAASFSFPSAAPSETTHWPFSGTARVSQAKRPSELIPCIRRQTRAMTRQLRDVEVLPEHVPQTLVGTEAEDQCEEKSALGELLIEEQPKLATTPTELGGMPSLPELMRK
jgi:hypothetical protein